MGWIGSLFVILGTWFVTDKNILGFIFGTIGNSIWIYVGLKRGRQYDLIVVATIMTILNLVGLLKWIN